MSEQLKNIQQSFMQALLNPQASEVFAEQVEASQALSARQHLAIYQRSYIARLQQCMAAQFNALKQALGEQLFFMFTAEYLQANPSKSYTLNNLGEGFADFLRATRPDKDESEQEDWPSFIIELAEFEYLLNVLFDAPELHGYKAASTDTPDTELFLNPVNQVCEHQYPVCRYFTMLKAQQQVDIPLPEPEYCVVVRHNYRLGMVELKTDLERQLISELARGKTWCSLDKERRDVFAIKMKWLKAGVLVSSKVY